MLTLFSIRKNIQKGAKSSDCAPSFLFVFYHYTVFIAAVFSGGKVIASGTPAEIFATESGVRAMGLDAPFTAKLTYALSAHGVQVDSDLTQKDFVSNLLACAKSGCGKAGLMSEAHAAHGESQTNQTSKVDQSNPLSKGGVEDV